MVEGTRAARQVMHIYQQVVSHFVQSLRPVFQDENTDEAVLDELAQLWLRKLQQRGTVVSGSSTSAAAAYPHQVAQVDGAGEDAAAPAIAATAIVASDRVVKPGPAGRASGSMAAAVCRPPPAEIAVVGAPACAAAVDAGPPLAVCNAGSATASARAVSAVLRRSAVIAQVDGGDKDDEFMSDDSELNSDDDDDDQASIDETDMENYIISQFDRIFRSKKKWKANLRHGIMQVRGVDVMFERAAGEWDW